MTAMHGISAAADKTARKIDRDEVLVMTVVRGVVLVLGGDSQWTGTPHSLPSQVVRQCEREGDTFTHYYVVGSDGSHAEI